MPSSRGQRGCPRLKSAATSLWTTSSKSTSTGGGAPTVPMFPEFHLLSALPRNLLELVTAMLLVQELRPLRIVRPRTGSPRLHALRGYVLIPAGSFSVAYSGLCPRGLCR